MNYIENIYICLAAPLLIAVLCLRGERQATLIALLSGMTSCLLSSYVSSYIAMSVNIDSASAAIQIAPAVEEIIKLLPLLFYLLIFEPDKNKASGSMFMIAVGFATFENACYLAVNGADNIVRLVLRGFGTGAMHVVCGMIVAIGLLYVWDRLYLRVAGTIGLLSVAITYHTIYNMLVSQDGIVLWVGYIIPLISVAVILTIWRPARS